ncbi:MAG TPA: hypothetical protein VFV98_08955 [Vicinamibacterales bacterium]|nr:hypothetical protein [Vicinamibacterales bacterium]
MRIALCTGLAIGMIALPICHPSAVAPLSAQTPVNHDAQVLADFNDRVKGYLALRDKVDGDAPPLEPTRDPGKIEAAQKTLAALIRNARAGAKQGDIFAPEIEKTLRALLRPEVKGAAGAQAKAEILDVKPMVELKVNAEYPSAEPVSTVPPTVLQALPPLPKDAGLEYRFVRKHMILLDTRANLIVDYLLNAIP